MDSFGQSILSLVGCKFLHKAKVDGSHSIESEVWEPHACKYLAHGADVLLRASFLNVLILELKDSCAYIVSKYLTEWHGVLDDVDVGWDLDPSAETVPFPPGCGVIVDLGRR